MKTSKIVIYTDVENVPDYGPIETKMGHVVYDFHPYARLSNGLLTLQGIPVNGYSTEYQDQIPKHYVFRNALMEMQFICGADLLEDGTFWANGKIYTSIQAAVDFEQTAESNRYNWPVSVAIWTEGMMNL
jgi:hypothetical protein